MISLTFFAVVLGLLFLLGFITKRRFGVLGLALAAGALLSANWAGTVTPFIEQQGISLVAPPLKSVVEVMLIILPALVLLFSGPTYSSAWPRVAGAVGFAILAFTFMIDSLGSVLQLDSAGQMLYDITLKYQSIVIVVGMMAAITDMLLTGQGHHRKKHG